MFLSILKHFHEGIVPMKSKVVIYPEEELRALRERNEERAKQVRQQMGETWVCHPKNAPQNNGRKPVLS